MILDNEKQRALLAQVIDHAARASVAGADPRSLQQVAQLVELRAAVERAQLAAPESGAA